MSLLSTNHPKSFFDHPATDVEINCHLKLDFLVEVLLTSQVIAPMTKSQLQVENDYLILK
jgi:hypothetical protein